MVIWKLKESHLCAQNLCCCKTRKDLLLAWQKLPACARTLVTARLLPFASLLRKAPGGMMEEKPVLQNCTHCQSTCFAVMWREIKKVHLRHLLPTAQIPHCWVTRMA